MKPNRRSGLHNANKIEGNGRKGAPSSSPKIEGQVGLRIYTILSIHYPNIFFLDENKRQGRSIGTSRYLN